MLVLRQENTGQNSVTLLWREPDQPNGIILEYEVKYYEKVTATCWPRPRSLARSQHGGLRQGYCLVCIFMV